MKKFVAYLRVSTKSQGQSGLGLEAQRAAVIDFVSREGGEVLAEFVEVETGKKADRPELAKALIRAKRAGAVLVVAKLDRLSRNLHFMTGLMESGVDFVACDNPHANRFTIHILAAVAEHEREMISQRTKAALAAAKERGVLLGSAREGHWEGREEARRRGTEVGLAKAHKAISAKARAEYADIRPHVLELHEQGNSLRQIAAVLNGEGHRTRRGAAFTAVQVQNILARE
jgi:DNA invertase Pin-like site-specific DNA recombinase